MTDFSIADKLLDLVSSSLGFTLAFSLNAAIGLSLHMHRLDAGYSKLTSSWIQFGINLIVVSFGLWIIYRIRKMRLKKK